MNFFNKIIAALYFYFTESDDRQSIDMYYFYFSKFLMGIPFFILSLPILDYFIDTLNIVDSNIDKLATITFALIITFVIHLVSKDIKIIIDYIAATPDETLRKYQKYYLTVCGVSFIFMLFLAQKKCL